MRTIEAEMKTCPVCGSVSPDSATVCGICGTDLAGAPIQTLERIELERAADANQEQLKIQRTFRRARTRRLILAIGVLTFAIGLIVTGVVLTSRADGISGIVLVIAGLFVLWMASDTFPRARIRR